MADGCPNATASPARRRSPPLRARSGFSATTLRKPNRAKRACALLQSKGWIETTHRIAQGQIRIEPIHLLIEHRDCSGSVDGAPVRLELPADERQKRALARAVAAGKMDPFAGPYRRSHRSQLQASPCKGNTLKPDQKPSGRCQPLSASQQAGRISRRATAMSRALRTGLLKLSGQLGVFGRRFSQRARLACRAASWADRTFVAAPGPVCSRRALRSWRCWICWRTCLTARSLRSSSF